MGSFTYTAGSGKKKDKVRLLLGDTHVSEPNKQIFTDAEINEFLSMGGNEVLRAAALAADTLATSSARSAIAWKAMGRSVDRKQVPKIYQEQAKRWRQEARQGSPAEEIHSVVYDIGRFGGRDADFVGDEL